MSLINVTNLTFAYDGTYDNIFENVSFQLDTDWKLGFIGRNGRGKTTFLHLLLGKYEYRGRISSSVSFEYFPYQVPDKEDYTINVVEQISPDSQQWELRRELNILEVPEEVMWRPFKTLSNGEQIKVLLAALFLKENSFLLIDEPTNHLDMTGRKIISDYLKSKKGFILVSHDRSFLDNCTDHIISINKTNIEIQKGNFSSWWRNKELQDSYELAENQKLLKDIKRLTNAARKVSAWSDKVEKTKITGKDASGTKPDKGYIGHKSAKMMARSKAIEARQYTAIEEKSKLLKNLESADNLKISPLSYHTGRLAEFDKVSIYYDEKVACSNVSFTIERGDRIALCGRNGSGKSSILKLICGEQIYYTGHYKKGSRLKLSYVSQDTSYLYGSLSEYASSFGIEESLFKTILRKLDFSRLQFEKDISDFSEGQKKKVLIARSLCEQAHLYIWDEPLNYIDVLSRIQIEELLLTYQPTIIFVEHDRTFSLNIASKIINLSSDGKSQ